MHVQLFQRRLTAATLCNGLKRHAQILSDLTIDGMSSDESEDEGDETGKPCYVTRPVWRAVELGPWLRVFDSLYLALGKEHGPGHGPHLRIYNHQVPRMSHNQKFVAHLPVNAYDVRWLERRNDIDFSIRPVDAYDFHHDAHIFRYVRHTPDDPFLNLMFR